MRGELFELLRSCRDLAFLLRRLRAKAGKLEEVVSLEGNLRALELELERVRVFGGFVGDFLFGSELHAEVVLRDLLELLEVLLLLRDSGFHRLDFRLFDLDFSFVAHGFHPFGRSTGVPHPRIPFTRRCSFHAASRAAASGSTGSS
ncbi:MAG: hypothetical protein KA385_13535 [Vicinamibacteria bacterium]|nr:hypothetical protein [Vicinamibacteria bacterium]